MEQKKKHKRRERWALILNLMEKTTLPVGLEVGVYKGKNFGYLMRGRPDLAMYGVDPYVPFDGGDGLDFGSKEFDAMYLQTKKYLNTNWPARSALLRMTSLEGAIYFTKLGMEFDFIFIDGNHRYKSVVADINAWWPLVRKNGFLIGHDYRHHILGDDVERAVYTVFGNKHETNGKEWWKRK